MKRIFVLAAVLFIALTASKNVNAQAPARQKIIKHCI